MDTRSQLGKREVSLSASILFKKNGKKENEGQILVIYDLLQWLKHY